MWGQSLLSLFNLFFLILYLIHCEHANIIKATDYYAGYQKSISKQAYALAVVACFADCRHTGGCFGLRHYPAGQNGL